MTQSPPQNNPTMAQDRPLVRGVGYTTVYMSEGLKIEISAKGTSMRRTLYENGVPVAEYLYEKISDLTEIRRIESSPCRWRTYDGGRYGYVIRGQLDAMRRPNGVYKVVESARVRIRRNIWGEIQTIDSDIGDWTYYRRRLSNEV